MAICASCGLEDDDLETDDNGEKICMDCLYLYDRELYNELTGEESDD